VGLHCRLGLRASVLPRWAGVVFIAVPFLGAAGLQGAVSLTPDYLLFIALFAVGSTQLRATRLPEAVAAVA
jgi:hypothetical protein